MTEEPDPATAATAASPQSHHALKAARGHLGKRGLKVLGYLVRERWEASPGC